jgi:hypothetical protein
MALTPINSEDRLVQATFAEHLRDKLGWKSVYAWNDETFGPNGTLGRKDTTEATLTRDLRAALIRLNLDLPPTAIDDAMRVLTVHDFSRSMEQHNQDFARLIRTGVPVSYRDAAGHLRNAHARIIDWRYCTSQTHGVHLRLKGASRERLASSQVGNKPGGRLRLGASHWPCAAQGREAVAHGDQVSSICRREL